MNSKFNITTKIFADGADKARILELCRNPVVKGFTTNPSLMRKAGVTDYEAFALDILPHLEGRPISFEVFSDEFEEMYSQARQIASWGSNVYVKIPITNTRGESSRALIDRLVGDGVQVNVTAVMTLRQVEEVAGAFAGGVPGYVSIFAGRVADSGRDPVPIMKTAVKMLALYRGVEVIWASPREVFNVVQAGEIGCHIITVTYELLKKLDTLGRDLNAFSLETVRMFYEDAQAAGYESRPKLRAAGRA